MYQLSLYDLPTLQELIVQLQGLDNASAQISCTPSPDVLNL